MIKTVASLLCLFLLQQHICAEETQHIKDISNRQHCAPNWCCIQNSTQSLEAGSKAADTNGLCKEYMCLDDLTYKEFPCPNWGPKCAVKPGNSSALYPHCCPMPLPNQEGCEAKFS